MKGGTAGRIQRQLRQLQDRLRGGSLVLLYHRIAQLPSDPQRLAVLPTRFQEHLEVINQSFSAVPLATLVGPKYRAAPKHAVALTFDDGYNDNLSIAKELLELNSVPATVFVVTGYVGQNKEFWWDELERLLLQPNRLPSTIDLRPLGVDFHCSLGKDADYTSEVADGNSDWDVRRPDNPSRRHAAYRVLHKQLAALAEETRDRSLSFLNDLAVMQTSMPRPFNHAVTQDELIDLDRGEVMTVGAHTVTHPILSRLKRVDQHKEIYGSKLALETWLGHPVTDFAYPYGELSHYIGSVDLVREAGFKRACSNFFGRVRRGSDPFQIPRMLVGNWSGEDFERRLCAWFAGNSV